MVVKGNQPCLLADIERLFRQGAEAAPRSCVAAKSLGLRSQVCLQAVGDAAQWPQPTTAETVELGHGRIERRRLSALSVPAGQAGINWPGRAQVGRVEREVTFKKSGKQRAETVYGITSAQSTEADAACLLSLVRGHWFLENGSHWVRDVTFDEDRSQVRTGRVPQVMAALRNTAIGLLRSTGATNIAASCRYYAARPWEALALLGVLPEN
jgi:predicted transposase YbfD/YdcC